MDSEMNSLALIISSCDKYSDLWDTHIELLNKNWVDKPSHIYLVTDKECQKDYESVCVYSAGSGLEMPQRLRLALEHIKEEYVLLTLDDYYLTKPIDSEKISMLIAFANREHIDYIRLFHVPNEKNKVEGEKGFFWIDLNNNYAINLYPGIWRKSFLQRLITDNVSAWDFEVSLTKKAKQIENAKCVLSKRGEFPILDVVRKGKVLHKANRYFKRHNIDIGNRPIVSYKTELRYFIVGTGSRIIPLPLRGKVKKILTKMGMRFYSDL